MAGRVQTASSSTSLGDLREANMTEGSSNAVVSRRSTRAFVEDQESMSAGNTGMMALDLRPVPCSEEEGDKVERGTRNTPANSTETLFEPLLVRRVDVGKDLSGIFPSTVEDLAKQITKCLQAAKSASEKGEGRPLNFGIIIPGVYRSSFPQTEDFEYLKALGLKSIVTLVKKDYPLDFNDFIKLQGIRHFVIDMEGTKKVVIPQAIMHSIMEIVLDKENHPLLMHCNHGKHRTGCATAVMRHVCGWNVDAILEEYKGYADRKIRDEDLKYITEYKVSTLAGLFLNKPSHPSLSSFSLLSYKMVKFCFTAAVALLIWYPTAQYFWKN